MYDDFINMSVKDIKRGYSYNKTTQAYECNICAKAFPAQEIFKIDSRYVKANKAAALHVEKEHGDMLTHLCRGEKRETGLTDNQKELLRLVSIGKTDKEIAKTMSVSASTVRHQKFVFRQKVKQAKMLIAVFELAQAGAKKENTEDKPVTIHKNAKMVDERYNVTEAERDKILGLVFESLVPLKLKVFSAKEKKKLVAITKIAELFELNRKYTEKEINAILEAVYADYVTLRRYLIEYGFLDRKIDGSEYWKK